MANDQVTDTALNTLASGSLKGLSAPIQSYSKVQLFYLLRLVHLRELRAEYRKTADLEWHRKLIDRSLFSTYLATCSLGVELDARSLLTDADANLHN